MADVGVACLSATLQVLFDRMASQEVMDFIRGHKLNDSLLKKLKPTLISVNALWDAAEEKQFSDPNIRIWLAELKDAVYDAEDLLDEIAAEAARSKLESEDDDQVTTAKRVISKLLFTHKQYPSKGMNSKLEETLGRLESLFNQRDILNLKQGKGERPFQRQPATSLVDDEFGVYGRDADKEAIMEYLMNPQYASGNHIGVIQIVGMGGLGKTTLAQLVYNDNRVKEWFDIQGWVCVSDQDFDAAKLTQTILQVINVRYDERYALEQLQSKLKQELLRKKFLFVLDDVWNRTDLEYLVKLLKFGEENSKIVVTTRNEDVGRIRRDVQTYQLRRLTDDDCWKLLAKRAFGNENRSRYPDLNLIGEEFAKKCKGLPLAATILGGVLSCSELDAGEWSKILRNNLWEEDASNILPPLRLSYYYLPPHLKRCFVYCSIFPKDYKIQKEKLVRLWMAEGLLAHTHENDDIQEVGNKCFKDLVSRSFFQQLSEEDKSCFVMHDLISDLAKSISGEFVCRLEGSDDSCRISKKTRHLSNVQQKYDVFRKFETLSKAKGLRTFLTLQQSFHCLVTSQILHDLIEKCRCLRVLSLAHYVNINELPEEIGNLKHLRHLNMSETSIKSLPNTLSALYHLQALLLFRCRNLVELPNDMRRLINLHYLDIRETKIVMMPKGMGELKDLRLLTDFVITEGNGSSISENLGKLKHLSGRLAIWGLQNVVPARGVKDANLKDKAKIKELKLAWMDQSLSWRVDYDIVDPKPHREALEQLEPHTNLERLVIDSYKDIAFPLWVGHSSFSNVVSLELCNCKYCVLLPPLGQLPSLKSLSVKRFVGLVMVGDEFYGRCGNSSKPFACLETLTFEDMVEWEEWSHSRDETFLVLKVLYISNCPKLSKSLPNNLPSLTKLEIKNCGNLGGLLPTAPPSFRELQLLGCDALQLEALPSGLQKLGIEKLKLSDSILEKMLQHCTHVEELSMEKCSNLVSLPQGSLSITLKRLKIGDCYRLDYSKMLLYTSIESLEIKDKRRCSIPQAMEECFPLPSFPMLNSLNIMGWQGLKSVGVLVGSHHHHLASLNSLNIFNCPNFICFQIEVGLIATNMTSLLLSDCASLKSFPEQMHSLFPSLEYLSISYCPEIGSFPEEGLPTKLKYLSIQSSDKLIVGLLKRKWNLQTLSSLTEFIIVGSELEALEFFPDEHLLPSSLTSLGISNLPNLNRLDGKSFRHLSSLRKLGVYCCPKLQSMPDKQFLSSLSHLIIWNCPLLKESCEKEKGKYWPNISHIPIIDVDGEVIL